MATLVIGGELCRRATGQVDDAENNDLVNDPELLPTTVNRQSLGRVHVRCEKLAGADASERDSVALQQVSNVPVTLLRSPTSRLPSVGRFHLY